MNPVKKWYRKCKRRKGGVYAKRMRKHANPFRREWGYVGESNSFKRRERDHEGRTAYQRADGVIQRSTEKPWMDLDVKTYRIIPLPWWLCWKWVLRPLETLVIFLLWPRYNDRKNRWNPRRVPIGLQFQQRAARDAGQMHSRARVFMWRMTRRLLQISGAALIVLGVVSTMIHR